MNTYIDTQFVFCGHVVALKSCGNKAMDTEAMSRFTAALRELYQSQFPQQSFEEMLAGKKLTRPAWCE